MLYSGVFPYIADDLKKSVTFKPKLHQISQKLRFWIATHQVLECKFKSPHYFLISEQHEFPSFFFLIPEQQLIIFKKKKKERKWRAYNFVLGGFILAY